MGVTFSHCDFGIGYGALYALQERLASEAGINLKKVHRDTCSPERTHDPLLHFLRCLDGHGKVRSGDCIPVKRRIEELAARFSVKDRHAGELALALANGMSKAAFLGEDFSWG